MKRIAVTVVALAALAALPFFPRAAADSKTPAPAPTTPAKPPAAAKAPISFDAKPAPGTKARCPVSGEEFVIKAGTQTTTHNGRVYAFCCPDCKPDFEKNPAKFTEKK